MFWSKAENNQTPEFEKYIKINHRVIQELSKHLNQSHVKNQGFGFFMDDTVSSILTFNFVYENPDLMNNSGTDIFISFHANSSRIKRKIDNSKELGNQTVIITTQNVPSNITGDYRFILPGISQIEFLNQSVQLLDMIFD